MTYDPKKFKRYQQERLAGQERKRVETSCADPWIKLAAGVITQTVRDLKRARGGRLPNYLANNTSGDPAKVVVDCEGYFRGPEFENHAALVGIDPDVVRRKLLIGKDGKVKQ